MENNEIGNKLRELREETGLSLTEAAEKIGVKPPQLSKWEHGKNVPRMERLFKIVEILNAEIKHTLGWDNIRKSYDFWVNADMEKLESLKSRSKQTALTPEEEQRRHAIRSLLMEAEGLSTDAIFEEILHIRKMRASQQPDHNDS